MSETTTNIINNEIKGKSGYFLVKLPKSKNMLLCTCDVNWTVKLLKEGEESETIKENLSKDILTGFLNSILSSNINKKSL